MEHIANLRGILNPMDVSERFQTKKKTDLLGMPPVLERCGSLELRLVTTGKELHRAQRLRYNVFYEEGGAISDRTTALLRRDMCRYDDICDHLVVIDRDARNSKGERKTRTVGTYRVLRGEIADRHQGFYSQNEFELGPMLERHRGRRFLELGRSCVHPDYRSKRVIELLWRGLWLYATHHRTDVLIGCASFQASDISAALTPLSFLRHHAKLADEWHVEPVAGRRVDFVPLAESEFEVRRAFVELPPLLKAYVRVGARFSESAVIDREFGTIDLFTVLPLADIEPRYVAHFGAPVDPVSVPA